MVRNLDKMGTFYQKHPNQTIINQKMQKKFTFDFTKVKKSFNI